MQKINFIVLFLFFTFISNASTTMNNQVIKTSIGEINVQMKAIEGSIPVIFLHGVYFDHHLWDYQVSKITDRTVITLDMPLHGKSKKITADWNLEDCGQMLLDILDSLNIPKVIAIGHSWGSMTILRAAHQQPQRFQSIGFCNMPFHAATTRMKMSFKLQHIALTFKKFYIKQVPKAMYGKQHRKNNPALSDILISSMSTLTKKEIQQTDRAVIVRADDATSMLNNLKVPSLALKGKEDYVPIPQKTAITIVEGGHVSPLEVPQEVLDFAINVINL